MARTLLFRMVVRKFSEITKGKPIFSWYNIFYNYEYFPFQPAFWSLFNHRQRSQSNQEQWSLCCSSPCFLVLPCTHYVPLQCFSTYFCKLKGIGVLRPIFPDYVISCDYGLVYQGKYFSFYVAVFSRGLKERSNASFIKLGCTSCLCSMNDNIFNFALSPLCILCINALILSVKKLSCIRCLSSYMIIVLIFCGLPLDKKKVSH